MMSKQIDFLSIGDLASDCFIRLTNAELHCKLNDEDCEICFPYGAKIPFEYTKVVNGAGNAGNAAVAASRLGLKTALISNVGKDMNGKDCLLQLKSGGVMTDLVKENDKRATNYHFVLWYGSDRTILVNHSDFDYRLPDGFIQNRLAGMPPKWIYLTSVAADNYSYYETLLSYLERNPQVKLAFQPGTFQLKSGLKLSAIYRKADVVIMNKEEASSLLGLSFTKVPELLRGLKALGPKLAIVTNGLSGAYLFDGDHYYLMPTYPDPKPPLERTGCGDSFASTFVSALVMGKTPLEALMWAQVTPMSVAQFVGSQEGLLTIEQIEWWLRQAPADFKPKEIGSEITEKSEPPITEEKREPVKPSDNLKDIIGLNNS